MKNMTLLRAEKASGGRLCGAFDGNSELDRIIIDSRQVRPGALFVAYKGENVDGHDYIAAAFQKGAACCLAQRIPEGETRPILLVEDVQTALERIAADYRRDLDIPMIGITGSVGKTSAKEMIASVLQQRFRVLKTDGNLNNQIGVPMTISRIEPSHQAAVVEMGISGFGEMRALTKIVHPTVAVFTVIGHAHLEFLHDRRGVFQAKTEMLEGMDENGVVIVNGDDDLLCSLECSQKKLSFGLGDHCDIRARDIRVDEQGHTACTILYDGGEMAVRIPSFGNHMIYAALEGAAVGLVLGLSEEEIIRGIAAYETVGSRAAVTETGKITLIDDSYNANPDSVKCGVDSLMQLAGRHVCVFGDMLELGPGEREMHRDAGAYAAEKGVDLILCTGPLSREMALGAGERGRWFSTREELLRTLPELIRQGDRVLVKASRGMHFESIAEALKTL